MVSQTVKIKNKTGLHARPANLFVKVAQNYQSKIEVKKGDNIHNGKSILSVMSLCANQGSNVTIIANGIDEVEAVQALVDLVNANLGEDEDSI